MKNRLFTLLFVFTAFMTSACFSETNAKTNDFPPPPPFAHFENKEAPHKDFHAHRPSRQEMEAKRAEFERRLNLTDEQKKQIEADKQKDREKIKPVIEKIKAKRDEINKIKENSELSEAEKENKISELTKELQELKNAADNCRKENMKRFESVLTEKQKAEFEKIKQEQKIEMEKRLKEHPIK